MADRNYNRDNDDSDRGSSGRDRSSDRRSSDRDRSNRDRSSRDRSSNRDRSNDRNRSSRDRSNNRSNDRSSSDRSSSRDRSSRKRNRDDSNGEEDNSGESGGLQEQIEQAAESKKERGDQYEDIEDLTLLEKLGISRKVAVIGGVVVAVLLFGILGFTLLGGDNGENEVQVESSVAYQDGQAIVTVSDMGGAEEVTVTSSNGETKTITSAGESVSFAISEGESLTLSDSSGSFTKNYSASEIIPQDQQDDTNDNNNDSDNTDDSDNNNDGTDDNTDDNTTEEVSYSTAYSDGNVTVTIDQMGGKSEFIVGTSSDESASITEEGGSVTLPITSEDTLTITSLDGNYSEEVPASEIIPDDQDSSDDDSETNDSGFEPTDYSDETHDLEGEGTEQLPYKISNAEDLRKMKYEPDAQYVLTSDIDASGSESWNDNRGFEPILEFSGVLNGNDYTITGLYINDSPTDYVGMFRNMREGTVKNLTLSEVNIQGSERVGGISGFMADSTVRNVVVSGNVSGDSRVGMIAGSTNPTTIENVIVKSSTVSTEEKFSGGVVGYNRGTIMDTRINSSKVTGSDMIGGVTGYTAEDSQLKTVRSLSMTVEGRKQVGGITGHVGNSVSLRVAKATGSVTGEENVGGIAGYVKKDSSILIQKLHSTATVSGTTNVGGLIGFFGNGTIELGHASATVEGTDNVGGLFGSQDNGTIDKLYSYSGVTGESNVGGVAGHVQTTSQVNAVYWVDDLENSPESNVGDGVGYGVGVPEEKALGREAETSMAEFNFEDNVWYTTQKGPVLAEFATESMKEPDSEYIADLTINLVDGNGDSVVGDVYIEETGDAYYVDGSRTIQIEMERDVSLRVEANTFVTKEETIYVTQQSASRTFTLVKENSTTELNVELQTDGGQPLMGEVTIGDEAPVKMRGTQTFSLESGTTQDVSLEVPGYTNETFKVRADSPTIDLQPDLQETNSDTVQHTVKITSGRTGELIEGTINVDGQDILIEDGFDAINLPEGESYTASVKANDYYTKDDITIETSETPDITEVTLEYKMINADVDISDSSTGEPISGTVMIMSTREEFDVEGGSATIKLPENSDLTLRASADGYQYTEKSVTTGESDTSIAFSLSEEVRPDCSTVSYNGSGTSSDPYAVTDLAQLQCMGENDPAAHYTLMNDIDASDTSTWQDGFEPIGTNTENGQFSGVFNGDGHTISNLQLTSYEMGGMFRTNTGYITDFTLSSPSITVDNSYAGTVAAKNTDNGKIENVTVSGGSVQSATMAGGLVGYHSGEMISASSSSASVSGDANIGGLVGKSLSTVAKSSSSGGVSVNNKSAGGLIGHSEGDIRKSFATGTVSASSADEVGGLVGTVEGTRTISNTYATGDVTGDTGVGGLVGSINEGAALKKSFAVGSVSGSSGLGGLVGQAVANATASGTYWDTEATGQSTSALSSTGLTTSEMSGDSATTNMSEMDYISVWDVTSDYPVFERNTTDGSENYTVSIDSTNSPVNEGDTLEVTVTIENTGTDESYQEMTLDVGGETRDTQTVGVVAGQTKTVSFEWDTSSGDAGSYTATVDTTDDTSSTSVEVQSS